MGNEFDIDRACRLRGQQPTTRERWTAFYRLWRMIRNSRSAQEKEAASLCFRVLMFDWRWIRLVDDPGGDELESLRFMPRDVRWFRVRKVARA